MMPHLETRCAQVHSVHRLLVFEKGKGFFIDSFRIPSGCVCQIIRSSPSGMSSLYSKLSPQAFLSNRPVTASSTNGHMSTGGKKDQMLASLYDDSYNSHNTMHQESGHRPFNHRNRPQAYSGGQDAAASQTVNANTATQLSNTLWSILMGGGPSGDTKGVEDLYNSHLGLLQHLKAAYPQLANQITAEQLLHQLTSDVQRGSNHHNNLHQKLMMQQQQMNPVQHQHQGSTTFVNGPGSSGLLTGTHATQPLVQVIHVPVSAAAPLQPIYKSAPHHQHHDHHGIPPSAQYASGGHHMTAYESNSSLKVDSQNTPHAGDNNRKMNGGGDDYYESSEDNNDPEGRRRDYSPYGRNSNNNNRTDAGGIINKMSSNKNNGGPGYLSSAKGIRFTNSSSHDVKRNRILTIGVSGSRIPSHHQQQEYPNPAAARPSGHQSTHDVDAPDTSAAAAADDDTHDDSGPQDSDKTSSNGDNSGSESHHEEETPADAEEDDDDENEDYVPPHPESNIQKVEPILANKKQEQEDRPQVSNEPNNLSKTRMMDKKINFNYHPILEYIPLNQAAVNPPQSIYPSDSSS